MFRKTHPELGDPAAGNGILSRRIFLEGALLVGASGAGLSYGSAEPLTVQPWMKVPGPGFERGRRPVRRLKRDQCEGVRRPETFSYGREMSNASP